MLFSSSLTKPFSKAIVLSRPSRHTVTSRRFDRAFVTDTPTPCRPPENEYAPPSFLLNLPPACSRVNTNSTTGVFSCGCRPTGMPRPSSSTEIEPSAYSVKMIFVPYSARTSSLELSITSWIICSGLSVRVYIPGLCLTGSRPFRTVMEPSE